MIDGFIPKLAGDTEILATAHEGVAFHSFRSRRDS